MESGFKGGGTSDGIRAREILLVTEDPQMLRTMDWAFSDKGHRVTTVGSGGIALEALSSKPFDVMIVDAGAEPGPTHPERAILKRAKQLNPCLRVIALASNPDWIDEFDRFPVEADEYIVKPESLPQLLNRMSTLLDRSEAGWNTAPVAVPGARSKDVLRMLMAMSHDIRGALVSIGAGLKLINRGMYGRVEPSVADKVEELCSRVKSLVGVAEDYLGNAFSLNGELEIEEESVDLKQDVVEPVLEEVAAELRESQIQLENRLEDLGEVRIPVRGSRIWMKTVFRNLFRNAIRYGGRGCTIGIEFEKGESFYRFNVFNTGRPVPEEHRDKLFTKFSSLKAERDGNHGGVGLGLYMVREIIQKHGGEMWYEADTKGSNFSFTLPQQ